MHKLCCKDICASTNFSAIGAWEAPEYYTVSQKKFPTLNSV